VASSRDSVVLRDGAQVIAPGRVAGIRGGQYSQDFAGYDSLDRAALVVPLSDPANADGCQPFSNTAVAGKYAWRWWADLPCQFRCRPRHHCRRSPPVVPVA